MPDPIPYNSSYDFSNYQANSPSTPLPGTQVDIQFADIQRAVLETIAALANVRRSDGALVNGIVTSDALAPNIVDQIVNGTITTITEAVAAALVSEQNAATSEENAAASETASGLSAAAAAASETAVLAVEDNLPDWKGAWVTGTVYDTGDLVRQEGASYICVIAHTAVAAFSTDLSGMRWELFAAQGAPGPGTGDLLAENDLSDLASVPTARSNLGVPATGTVLLKSDNLAGLANTATAQTNLGLPSGTTGRAVLVAADQATGRTALGLGTAATRTAEATLTDGSNLPDGAAVKAYVDGQAVGIGQVWQSPSRSANVAYRNTTGRPIQIIIEGVSGGVVQASTNGSTWITLGLLGSPGNYEMSISAVIPDDHYYRTTGGFTKWLELR